MAIRVDRSSIIKLLMEEKDASKAMASFLEQCQGARPASVKSRYHGIRTFILRSGKYERQECRQEIYNLADKTDNPELKDYFKILSTRPINEISACQNAGGHGFILDKDLTTALKGIQIIQAPFYDFKLPVDINQKADEDAKAIMEEKRRHQFDCKDSTRYQISDTEIDMIIQKCVSFIQSDVDTTKFKNMQMMVEAVSFLTGRRKHEVARTLQMRSVKLSDFQAEVRGIGKKNKARRLWKPEEDEWLTIPLLAPIHIVIEGLCKARRYPHPFGNLNSSQLIKGLDHTKYRNVYADRCYRDRHINKFGPDHCAPLHWKSLALRICFATLVEHYSNVEYTGINRGEEVEDQHGGSRKHLLEDAIRCGGQSPNKRARASSECIPSPVG